MELIESYKVENIICSDVKESETKDIIKNVIPDVTIFIKELNKKLKKINCVGLAAPQWGDFRKYFIRYYEYDKYNVIFNARYINNHSSKIQSTEGCFSYDLGKKLNTVRRWKSIILLCDIWSFEKDELIKKQKIKLQGIDSIVIQHEVNHLYGITIFNKKN